MNKPEMSVCAECERLSFELMGCPLDATSVEKRVVVLDARWGSQVLTAVSKGLIITVNVNGR